MMQSLLQTTAREAGGLPTNRPLKGSAYYESEERKAEVERRMEEDFKKIEDDIGTSTYLVELEYEDHTEVGSALEHDILPNQDFTVRRFSHH